MRINKRTSAPLLRRSLYLLQSPSPTHWAGYLGGTNGKSSPSQGKALHSRRNAKTHCSSHMSQPFMSMQRRELSQLSCIPQHKQKGLFISRMHLYCLDFSTKEGPLQSIHMGRLLFFRDFSEINQGLVTLQDKGSGSAVTGSIPILNPTLPPRRSHMS